MGRDPVARHSALRALPLRDQCKGVRLVPPEADPQLPYCPITPGACALSRRGNPGAVSWRALEIPPPPLPHAQFCGQTPSWPLEPRISHSPNGSCAQVRSGAEIRSGSLPGRDPPSQALRRARMERRPACRAGKTGLHPVRRMRRGMGCGEIKSSIAFAERDKLAGWIHGSSGGVGDDSRPCRNPWRGAAAPGAVQTEDPRDALDAAP